MKSTLDSIFKVGFGVDLNTLSGLDFLGNQFIRAFDDSNVIVYWRYVDLLWRIKKFLNLGSEAALKRNIKVIDSFIFELIRCKREQMTNKELDVSQFYHEKVFLLCCGVMIFFLFSFFYLVPDRKRGYTIKVSAGE